MAQKTVKLSKTELKELQTINGELNKIIFNIGLNAIAQSNMLTTHTGVQKTWSEFENKLNSKYGNVSVNIQDGTIAPVNTSEESKEQ